KPDVVKAHNGHVVGHITPHGVRLFDDPAGHLVVGTKDGGGRVVQAQQPASGLDAAFQVKGAGNDQFLLDGESRLLERKRVAAEAVTTKDDVRRAVHVRDALVPELNQMACRVQGRGHVV